MAKLTLLPYPPSLYGDDLGHHSAISNRNESHGQRQGETPCADSARIEEQTAAAPFEFRAVGVAEDDQPCLAAPFAIDIFAPVGHAKGDASEFTRHHLRQPCNQAGDVGVAAHCLHRRHPAELIEDFGFADISGVQDVVTAGDQFQDPGAQQTVSVGQNGDSHNGPILS